MTKPFIKITLLSLLILTSLGSLRAQKYSDSITVNLFLLDECKITQYMIPELQELYDTYQSENLQFVAYFSNFSSKPPKIEAFVEEYKLPMAIKTDYYKSRAKLLGATVAPEVVVYDEKNEEILYQGRISNAYAKIGTRRRVVTQHDLRNSLQAIIENKEIESPVTTAIGCYINFNELN